MLRRMVGGKHPQSSYKGHGDDIHMDHVSSGSVAVEGTRAASAVDGTFCLRGKLWIFCAPRLSYRQSSTGAPTHVAVSNIQEQYFLCWSRTLVLVSR